MSKTNSPPPDIPEKRRSNPFAEGTFMHDIFGDVLAESRDMIILVTDHRGRRGTGKTVASLNLASQLDQTPEGVTWDKCTLDAEEIRNAYATQPKGSALVLDEIEQTASNREAMTNTNKALREIMSMGRVEEKYVIANVPIKSFVDKDILNLCSVWISMTRKGQGLVHNLKWEPYSEQLYPEQQQWLNFEDIKKGTQLREVYNKLTREKRKRISGDDGSGFVAKEEHKEEIQQQRKEARKETRDEFVASVYQHPGIDVSQSDLGDAVGVSQKTVSNIMQRQE
jgi:hypothetical protein